MAPPSMPGQRNEFSLRRAATHPPMAAHHPRCPRSGAGLNLILPQELCKRLLFIVHHLEATARHEQLFKALFEVELSHLFRRQRFMTSPTKQRPRPTNLRINPAVTATGSGAAFPPFAPSIPSECNRSRHFEPYSPTLSTSSLVSAHDDIHNFY